MYKANDFVLITSIVFNEGKKDEHYKTYSGIISYESDKSIGFSKAVVHQIWKNYETSVTMSECFSINKTSVKPT
jgi:hypothetical protein